MASTVETYTAIADEITAKELGETASPFTIEVRFLGGLTTAQKKAFKLAADRWTKVIVGDLPSVNVGGEVIDDIVIEAQGQAIDGPGQILGQSGPTAVRPASAGKAAFLPAKGIMSFDTADLAQMEKNKTLNDVITHEMGHVLGIGSIWTLKKLLKGAGTSNPTFSGKAACKEYGILAGGPNGKSRPVPVENTGGPGTREAHWRETVFRNELMSGWIAAPGNPLSRMTAASLGDMGYVVSLDGAEPYALPNLLEAAEGGTLVPHAAPIDNGLVLPNIPTVLPDSAMV